MVSLSLLLFPACPDLLMEDITLESKTLSIWVRSTKTSDWAWRKGRRYGTILCDLERHVPVDLLPDRDADSVASWLKAHPGVEIISLDRAHDYAAGARRGAPHAVLIADRFHLTVRRIGAYSIPFGERRG